MSESTNPQATTAYALATWVFLMHVGGVTPDDADLCAHCEAVAVAQDETAGDAAGEALVERVKAMLGGIDPNDVESFARSIYGDRVGTGFGEGARADRLSRIRKYQFDQNHPWLARIWERQEGQVAPVWLVVERVTDEVTAVDPNPWNDIDETRHIPVSDFQVLWELDGCTAVALV